MGGRRVVAALAVAALVAAGCHGATRASRPTASTTGAPAAPAIPSYAAGRSRPVADPVYPDFGNPAVDVLHYQLALRWSPSAGTPSGTATLVVRGAAGAQRLRA